MNINPVCAKDYKFLYELLKKRNSDESISHKAMPTYKEHVAFNKARPYAEDYIIYDGSKKVGRLYVTYNREIGIWVDASLRQRVFDLLLKDRILLFANVSPKNKEMQRFFKKNGFKLIQYTYRRDS